MTPEDTGATVTTDEEDVPVARCPVLEHYRSPSGSTVNQHWWPDQLNLKILNKNSPLIDPMGEKFDYAEEFKSLDFGALKADIEKVMTTSQDWWPADYGHYGPLFIRMAWHSAGTYRIHDGRGGGASGTQRFAPLNSWPDNVSLDKARRLLWPVKQKYGRKISWADLIILAGNCALESMGFKTFGFGGGREDVWEPEEDIYWGPETIWLGDERYSGDRELANPLGAVQMGLIYVNPEGPNGNPDPAAAARDIRETFARMAMNDEETVALIAGGHTFGKTHGAADVDLYVGREPEGAGIEEQGLGWRNTFGSGKAGDAITSGLEVVWTSNPTKWDNNFFQNLFGYEWELTKSPAGANQWRPTDRAADNTVPDAHDPSKRHAPMMLTTDLSLRVDPIYEPISRRFYENPDEFADAFARAWYKLVHRDMGPISRYLGPEVAEEQLIWQDPVPAVDHELVDGEHRGPEEQDHRVRAARVPAGHDRVGVGVDFPRQRQARRGKRRPHPPRSPEGLGGQQPGRVGDSPTDPRGDPGGLQQFTAGREESLARRSDRPRRVCRCRAGGQECRARGAGAVLAGAHGRFARTDRRGLLCRARTEGRRIPQLLPGWRKSRPEDLLVDRASLLGLTAPEMTVLVGGFRVLNANAGRAALGVFTDRPETLTNDFFVNLLDMGTKWQPSSTENVYEGRDRETDEVKWTGTAVDLVFGSNSQLRAIAEVYGSGDAQQKFVQDFVAAWHKVMNLDRFDLT